MVRVIRVLRVYLTVTFCGFSSSRDETNDSTEMSPPYWTRITLIARTTRKGSTCQCCQVVLVSVESGSKLPFRTCQCCWRSFISARGCVLLSSNTPPSKIPSMPRSYKPIALVALVLLLTSLSFAQNPNNQRNDAEERTRRNAIEAELQSLAVVERKVMVPMRDGVRMQADIYRPKGNDKAPIIFSRMRSSARSA